MMGFSTEKRVSRYIQYEQTGELDVVKMTKILNIHRRSIAHYLECIPQIHIEKNKHGVRRYYKIEIHAEKIPVAAVESG